MFAHLLILWMSFASAEQLDSPQDVDAGVALSEAPLLDPPTADETEARTYALGKILRCPVCQGLSVADSQSDAAVAMKNRIKELVALGYADDQIVDYFIGRYGEFVLLQPKSEHWFVWMAPFAALLLGGIVIVSRLRTTSEASRSEPAEQSSVLAENGSPTDDKYRAQILAELED